MRPARQCLVRISQRPNGPGTVWDLPDVVNKVGSERISSAATRPTLTIAWCRRKGPSRNNHRAALHNPRLRLLRLHSAAQTAGGSIPLRACPELAEGMLVPGHVLGCGTISLTGPNHSGTVTLSRGIRDTSLKRSSRMVDRTPVKERFKDKVAIVTGRVGIGRAIVEEWCKEGWRSPFPGSATSAKRPRRSWRAGIRRDSAGRHGGGILLPQRVDGRAEWGKINYLVNNAFSFTAKAWMHHARIGSALYGGAGGVCHDGRTWWPSR